MGSLGGITGAGGKASHRIYFIKPREVELLKTTMRCEYRQAIKSGIQYEVALQQCREVAEGLQYLKMEWCNRYRH
jgi:hypothetical protein